MQSYVSGQYLLLTGSSLWAQHERNREREQNPINLSAIKLAGQAVVSSFKWKQTNALNENSIGLDIIGTQHTVVVQMSK
jgi:hypothetical protein